MDQALSSALAQTFTRFFPGWHDSSDDETIKVNL